jgi:putative ABC transport system ATP-binding protein
MLIDIRGLEKAYLVGEQPFLALSGVDLTIDSGELVFVVGKSGSGKSTLLNMIAGLDRPSSGEVAVADTPVHALDEDALARFRGEMIGVVFQFFQLLPTLTAAENVMLAMDFVGKVPASRRRGQALALLEEVGVGDQADKLPTALSGGQQQRVAIARALANDPPLVVADEPTGNLDSQTATSVMELFARLTVAGKTVVLVTHEQESGVKPTRIVSIADGRIAA